MALFGDEEGDVGPFVMTEDGEEWFPFTLDNLEMDRECTSLDQGSNPMEQVRLPRSCSGGLSRVKMSAAQTHPFVIQ